MGECCLVRRPGHGEPGEPGEAEEENVPYILGVRMRKTKEVRGGGAFPGRPVPGGPQREGSPKDPDPLQVKEYSLRPPVHRLLETPKEARKDARDREGVVGIPPGEDQQRPRIPRGEPRLPEVSQGEEGKLFIDEDKVKEDVEIRWEVGSLRTNTGLPGGNGGSQVQASSWTWNRSSGR